MRSLDELKDEKRKIENEVENMKSKLEFNLIKHKTEKNDLEEIINQETNGKK